MKLLSTIACAAVVCAPALAQGSEAPAMPKPVLSHVAPLEPSRRQEPSTVCVEPCSYLAAMQRRMKDAWHPPKVAESLAVKVRFEVLRDGSIVAARVFVPSGNSEADAAALNAVESVSPVRRLPDLSPDKVEMEMTFSRKLNEPSNHHFTAEEDKKTFDSVAWKSTAKGRIRMIDDLLENHKVVGRSRRELINLLGKPQSTEGTSDDYPLIKYDQLVCGRCQYTTLQIEYQKGYARRYRLTENPSFLENYSYAPNPYFPDLRVDMTWHYK